MRPLLFIILISVSLPASAQWWRIDLKLKKKPIVVERAELIEPVKDHSVARLPSEKIGSDKATIHLRHLDRTDYSYEAEEAIVMKEAQHNMRFRIYADASYNFSELARLYIKQNRLSEAKWYLLQSNLISRQQNDDKHTISNLIDLATIKANIGDYAMANDDLTEAYDIACSRGFNDYLTEIEKKILYLKQNRLTTPKIVLRYAEAVENNSKTGEIKR